MRIIPPLPINQARLTAIDVPEPSAGETVYSVSTSYALGARVISTTTHRTYESLVASNLGHPLTDLTKWADVGPTNRYAMFDDYRNTATVQADGISFTITPGQRVDTLALLNLTALSCDIVIKAGSPAVEVYNRHIPLASRNVASWSQYFFTSFTLSTEIFQFDIPPYSDNEIHITLNGGGDVKIGAAILGMGEYMGVTKLPVTDGALNFSKIDRNDFGDVQLIPRRSVPTTEVTVFVDKAAVPRLRKLRDAINARPVLWVGEDDPNDAYFNSLLRFGVYKNFTIEIDQPDFATTQLSIEDL